MPVYATSAGITLLTSANANDLAVNNQLMRQLVSLWQSRGLRRVVHDEFERGERLEHDLIDPSNPKQRVDVVYPIILNLAVRSRV